MFVCGLDKKAVHQALMIKYNDVIKANEYLEKIFDFSFNMPDSFDVDKALRVSLQEFKNDSSEYQSIIKNVSDMLKTIGFTNPRHIKKVINKYIIFRYFSNNQATASEYDILKNLKFQKDNMFFLLVFFYLIVLYEFDKEEYEDLKKVEVKTKIFKDKNIDAIIKREEIKPNRQDVDTLGIRKHMKSYFIENLVYATSLLKLETVEKKSEANTTNIELMRFINFFLPLLSDNMEYSLSSTTTTEYVTNLEYLNVFKGYRFARYIHDLTLSVDKIEPIKILELIEIIDKLS